MNPQATLLPLTYGISQALEIASFLLGIITFLLAVLIPGVRHGYGRWVRPTLGCVAVVIWSLFTFMVSSGYVSQYAAAVDALQKQQPVPTDQVATAALVLQLQPTIWAVKMIALGLIGVFIWVGNSRSRAAAAMLLAYSNMPFEKESVQKAAPSRVAVEHHPRFAGTASWADELPADRVAEGGPVG